MNPIKYNNVQLPNWFRVLNGGISGLDVTSPFEIEEFTPTIGAGSKNIYIKRKNRMPKIKGDVVGGSASEIRERIASLAQYVYPVVDLVPIDFGIDDKTYLGTLIGTDTDEKNQFGVVTLSFKCDSYRYGDAVSELDINGKILTNAGTEACEGIFSFTLTEETSFNITLSGTTGYIGIVSAPAGDYQINLKTRKLYKDGVLANTYFDGVNTKFERFVIAPGSYTVNVSESVVVDYDYTETF